MLQFFIRSHTSVANLARNSSSLRQNVLSFEFFWYMWFISSAASSFLLLCSCFRYNSVESFISSQTVFMCNWVWISEFVTSQGTRALGCHLDWQLTWHQHLKTKKEELNIKFISLYWLLGWNSKLWIDNKLLISLKTSMDVRHSTKGKLKELPISLTYRECRTVL